MTKPSRHLDFILLCIVLLASAFTEAAAGDAKPRTARYNIDTSKSYFIAIAKKTGLFSFAAHDHAIVATRWSATESIDPSDFANSSISVVVPVSSLIVDSDDARRIAGLGAGPSPEDVRKIQARMLGPEVLDAENYKTIRFTASSVKLAGKNELHLSGRIYAHGRSREILVPVSYVRGADGAIEFTGRFSMKQTDFGIEPVSIGLGAIRVKDDVRIRFHVSMLPVP